MHNRMSEQLNTQEQSAYSPKPISEEKRITNIYIYIVDGIWVLLTARYLRNNTKRTQQNQCLAAHGPVFSDSFFLSHFVWFWISDYISHSRTLYANGVRSMKKQNGKKKLQLVHKFKGVELFFFFFFSFTIKKTIIQWYVFLCCSYIDSLWSSHGHWITIWQWGVSYAYFISFQPNEHSSRASNSTSANSCRNGSIFNLSMTARSHTEERNQIGQRRPIASPN